VDNVPGRQGTVSQDDKTGRVKEYKRESRR
jgi:hypothetical protein